MNTAFSRRSLLALFGAGSLLGGLAAFARQADTGSGAGADLQSAIERIPVTDVHAHAFPPFAPVTERIFLAELALGTWMLDAYFPTIDGESAFDRWKMADDAEKTRLDRQYGIEKRLDEVCYHMSTTVFVEYLVKEMARFLRCKPALRDVVAARNEYTKRDYWQYVNDLFASVKLENLFIQGGIGTWTLPPLSDADFSKALKARVHHVAWAAEQASMYEDISFDELVSRHAARLEREVKQNNAVAFKSGIVKNVGADVQPWSREQAEQAWKQFKSLPPQHKQRVAQRTSWPESARIVTHYLLWQTCKAAFNLDVPLHIHSGNGEGQDNLSSHYPYKLENVIRYPVEFPQKPVKIVMIHGGYPHVDEAAYLTHIFPNVWYDTSLMNPIANRGLHERMLTIFETAPMSKIMHGSDAYHLPEFFFAAAKWGRRYTASALAVLVDGGVLTQDEAVRAAEMILWKNAHKLHRIDGMSYSKS